MLNRCFEGGHITSAYIGETKCLPFSRPERMKGVWIRAFEGSNFYPGVDRYSPSMDRDLSTWLAVDDRTADAVAGKFDGTPKAYVVEIVGRRSLCAWSYGHMGVYANEVLADRLISVRQAPGLR
jgi:hypothetical protein